MKNNYRPVPPGKVLIFRYSRALGRTIPMFVDGTPEQRKHRSAKARGSRPGHSSRTEKALTQAQLPQMSAVTVAPTPTLYPQHPGAHGEVHDIFGAAAGVARALHRVPTGQSAGCNLLEAAGGLVGGVVATYASARIGQNMPKEHAHIIEGVTEKAVTHGPEVAQRLRKRADEFGQRAAAEAGPNGNGRQLLFLFMEMMMRIGAGMVNGAPAGARAHLALVNPSEKNIQLFTSSI